MSDAHISRVRALTDTALVLFVVSLPILCWAVELGVALTASHLLGFAVIGIAVWTCIESRTPPVLDVASVGLLAFLAIACLTVVLLWTRPDVVLLGESVRYKAVKQLAGLCFAVFLFFSLRVLMSRGNSAFRMLRVHYVTAVVVALLALLQYGVALWDIGSPLAEFEVYNSTLGPTRGLMSGNRLYGFPRVSLTLVEPSRLSMYLLTAWGLWAYGMTRRVPAASAAWSDAAGVLLGATILVAGSRLGHATFACLAVIAIAVRPDRVRRAALIGVSALVAAALIGPGQAVAVLGTVAPQAPAESPPVSVASQQADILPGEEVSPGLPDPTLTSSTSRLPWAQRLYRSLVSAALRADRSVEQRIGSVLVTWGALYERPWFGAGYGTSESQMRLRYPRVLTTTWQQERIVLMSTPGTVLVETGVIGLAVIVTALAGVLGALWRVGRSQSGSGLAWGAAGALAAYLFSTIVRAIEVYQFLLLWFLLAAALSIQKSVDGDLSERRYLTPDPTIRS